MKRIQILICVTISFLQCAPDKAPSYFEVRQFENFTTTYELTGNRLSSVNQNTFPGLVFRTWILDSLFIAYDMGCQTGNYFYVFNKDDYKLIASFGRLGQGPGEGVVAGDAYLMKDNRKILQHMQDKELLYAYNLDSAIALGKQYIPEVDYRDFKSYFQTATNEKYYSLANSGREVHENDDKVIKVIDRNSGKAEKIGSRFLSPDVYENPMVNLAYNLGNVLVNEKRNVAVISYYRWQRLGYINLSSPKTYYVVGPNDIKPEIKTNGKIEFLKGVYGYRDMCSGGNFLFCAYIGMPAQGINIPSKRSYLSSKEVHVFDWEGNAVARLQLDSQFEIITVDWNKKRLICIDPTSFNPIIEYDLSNIKEIDFTRS